MGTSVTDLDAVLVDLMVTPPAGFVAERNRLAKELRAGGDGDAAAAVGKLRRPALSDWALNMASAKNPTRWPTSSTRRPSSPRPKRRRWPATTPVR